MIGDLFKIFIEEPEKLTKVGLRILNTIFLLIIAEWLYRKFFGNYTLMNLTAYQDWVNFILSGRLLIIIACYLIARYFLEPIPSLFLYLIVVRLLCTRRVFKIQKSSVKDFLQFLDIIKFDKERKIARPGKNIDTLYKIASSFKDEEELENYNGLKYSLLNNILNLYFLFIVLYFFFFNRYFHNAIFIWIVIIGFIISILLYVLLNNLIEFMQKEHEDYIVGIEIIKSHHVVYETLSKLYIKPYKDDARIGKEDFFEFMGKSYALIIADDLRPIRPDDFFKYLKKLNSLGRHLFFITKKGEELRSASIQRGMGNFCTIISYESHSDLKNHLNEQLLKKGHN